MDTVNNPRTLYSYTQKGSTSKSQVLHKRRTPNFTLSVAASTGLSLATNSRENCPKSPPKDNKTSLQSRRGERRKTADREFELACRDLQTACDGDAEKLEEVLSSKNLDPREPLLKGKPPLYWAVVRGKLSVVKLLVEKYGCSPQFVTGHGGTSLFHAACSRGHVDIAKYLYSTHDVEATTLRKDGSTPIMAACYYGHLDVVRYLMEEVRSDVQLPASCSADGTLLHIACSNNQVAVARYLVSHCKLDPSASRAFGETPMHVTCSLGHLETVKYLKEELNCSLEVCDETDNTPLHLSVQNNQQKVVKYLLENECKTEVVNNQGLTPLMIACQYGKRESAKLLLELGHADPNFRNGDKESPLQCTRDKTIITDLVRHGANTTNFVSSVLNHHQKQSSLKALVRMFVVGHPLAGKSTLVEALKVSKSIVQCRLFNKKKVTGVAPLTAGIVPIEFECPDLGRVLLFDFAGQNEYYASHAALLEASKTSAPLFVLVINLLEEKEEIKFQVNFWLSFINNHHIPGTSLAHLAVIGSHKDKLHKEYPLLYQKKLSVVEGLIRDTVCEYSSLQMIGFFPTDCRKPHKHSKLGNKLSESCKKLRNDSEIDGCCHVLSVFLAEKFAGEVTCAVEDVIGEIRKSDLPLPCTTERMCELVDALSERQNILFLRNGICLQQSWIVLEVDTLLSKINGCIFAPINFKEHRTCSDAGTGVLPWSHLQRTFHDLDLDPKLVVAFLKKLEFCEEVVDPDVLALLQQGEHTSEGAVSSSVDVVGEGIEVPSRSLTTPGRYCSAAKLQEKDERFSDIGISFSCSPPVFFPTSLNSSPSFLSPTFQPNATSRSTTHPQLKFAHSNPAGKCFGGCEREVSSLHGRMCSVRSSGVAPRHPQFTQRQKSHSSPNLEQSLYPARGRRSQSCNQLTAKSESRFFFFPSLIGHERPSGETIWDKDGSFGFHCGWCLQVAKSGQFFTPRFLQILLLRISFGFAVAKRCAGGYGNMSMRQCTVWKNGIRWLDLNGIETVVEMEQNRAVVMLMRGKVCAELECVSLRSTLVQLVLDVKNKFCRHLQVDQYLIDPKHIAHQPYPLAHRTLNTLTLYELSMVATSLVQTKEWVLDTKGGSLCHLTNLLHFEPYANLGRNLLGKICAEESEKVTDAELYDFLHEYSQAHYTHAAELSAILLKSRKLLFSSPGNAVSMMCSCGSISHLSMTGFDSYSHHSYQSIQSALPQNGWHSPCCTTGSRCGSSPCMEVLEKWWNTSHDVTLADFRRLLDGYSLFPNMTLLELYCCPELSP